jgi:hypothetical protein
VVEKDDGSVIVVEFKTGRPHRRHQEQLNWYVDAARTLYPHAYVTGHLIYAD